MTEPAGTHVSEPLVNIGGRIPASLRRRLRVYAAATDRTMAELLEEAIVEWLERHDA